MASRRRRALSAQGSRLDKRQASELCAETPLDVSSLADGRLGAGPRPSVCPALTVPVRMGMTLADAEMLERRLLAERCSGWALRLRELLWLRAILIEQWRKTPVIEREAFEERADRVLEQLWDLSEASVPSEPAVSVAHDDKR